MAKCKALTGSAVKGLMRHTVLGTITITEMTDVTSWMGHVTCSRDSATLTRRRAGGDVIGLRTPITYIHAARRSVVGRLLMCRSQSPPIRPAVLSCRNAAAGRL